jgi:hypothetical protein
VVCSKLEPCLPQSLTLWLPPTLPRRSLLGRRYVYLFPLRERGQSDVDVLLVDAMLRRLAGRALDFTAVARDTPAGKACECRLLVRGVRGRLLEGGT